MPRNVKFVRTGQGLNKKMRSEDRIECFHNGIILIANCFQNCSTIIQNNFLIASRFLIIIKKYPLLGMLFY